MKSKTITHYFKEGFVLAQKSLDVFIIAFVLPYLINVLFIKTSSGNSLFFALIILLFTTSIFITVPQFLTQKMKGLKITLFSYFKNVFNNALRLMLPGIIIFFILTIPVFVMTFAFVVFDDLSINELLNLNRIYTTFILIVAFFLFGFTAYFFTLQRENLFVSLWHSSLFSFRNIKYVSILVMIKTIAILLATWSFPRNYVIDAIIYTFNACLLFWVVCTTLIYFNKNIRTTSQNI